MREDAEGKMNGEDVWGRMHEGGCMGHEGRCMAKDRGCMKEDA